MNRYLVENIFGVKGWNIAWYGVIIGFGFMLGIALAAFRSKKYEIKKDLIYDFILLALPISIICARAYYVIFEWKQYANNPVSALWIWKGGLAIYGGVIGGALTAIIFCKLRHVPLLQFLDLVAPSLVLGQAIGRWGNFVNQEAFGNLVTNHSMQFFPYAVFIEELGEWHQATFFYESMWNVCLLTIMLLLSHKSLKRGTILCLYLTGYGLGRFIIEGLRTDSLYLLPGVRVSQLLSMLLVFFGIALYFAKVRNRNI